MKELVWLGRLGWPCQVVVFPSWAFPQGVRPSYLHFQDPGIAEDENIQMTIPVIQARRFMVGEYEVIAQPIAHSAHMLRYNVFRNGKRIGGLASVPSESDCRFLEYPPVVPPLKTYSVTSRPGRPKKNAKRPASESEKTVPLPREELPHEIALPGRRESHEG